MTENASQSSPVVAERLRAWNPRAVSDVVEFRGETTLVIPHDLLRGAAEICRTEFDFDLLSDATCVDRFPLQPRFELQYHLLSIPRRARLRLRTSVAGENPVVDSLVPVWPGAGWLEREIFDLFGVHFTGHPDLRRILLPEDWEGYPLRRDYPVEGFRDVPFTPGARKSSV